MLESNCFFNNRKHLTIRREGRRLIIDLLYFTVFLGLANVLVVYVLSQKVLTPAFFTGLHGR